MSDKRERGDFIYIACGVRRILSRNGRRNGKRGLVRTLTCLLMSTQTRQNSGAETQGYSLEHQSWGSSWQPQQAARKCGASAAMGHQRALALGSSPL